MIRCVTGMASFARCTVTTSPTRSSAARTGTVTAIAPCGMVGVIDPVRNAMSVAPDAEE